MSTAHHRRVAEQPVLGALQHMAQQLLQLKGSAVAIVGHAHMAGIQCSWRNVHGHASVHISED